MLSFTLAGLSLIVFLKHYILNYKYAVFIYL